MNFDETVPGILFNMVNIFVGLNLGLHMINYEYIICCRDYNQTYTEGGLHKIDKIFEVELTKW